MRKAKAELAPVLQLVPRVAVTPDPNCLEVADALAEYRRDALRGAAPGAFIYVVRPDGSATWCAHGSLGAYNMRTLTSAALFYAAVARKCDMGVHQ